MTQELLSQTKLTLEDAKLLLMNKNVRIRQSELQEKIAEINEQHAFDAFLPNLGLSLNTQNTMGLNFDQISGQLITGNNWTNFANANISTDMILFQGFKKINEVRSSRLGIDLSKLDTEKLKQELQIHLISLYYQTLINLDLMQASISQSKLSEKLVELEELKIEVGKSTIVDLSQAKNKFATDQLNIANSRNAYHLSMLQLKQLLELDIDDNIEMVKPVEEVAMEFLFIRQHIDNDIYIRAISKKVEVANLGVRAAKSAYYPTISFQSGYGTNFSSRRYISPFSNVTMPLVDQINANRSLFVSLALSYNIFDRFTTRSNVSKSKISLLSTSMEKERIIRERKLEIEKIQMEYLAAVEENKAARSSYEATKMSYEAMNERYNVGKSSAIDTYKTLTEYNIAEFKLIVSEYNKSMRASILNYTHSQSLGNQESNRE